MTLPRKSPPRSGFESYLSDIDRTSLLDAEQERDLARRIAGGDPEARDRMVRANLRLVVAIARRYAGKGLPLDDLVAEGNLGLVRAVEGFDPDAGTRFSTYAAFWVRQSIRSALNRSGRVVRLPHYAHDLLAAWRRASAELQAEFGRAPSEEEVAARLGLDPRKVRVVRRALRVYNSAQDADPSEGAGVAEVVADPRGAAPDARLADEEDLRRAVDSLDRVGEREAAVLRLRFGLAGDAPLTLREVGDRLGYTRERIRQIEREALEKLRQCLAGG